MYSNAAHMVSTNTPVATSAGTSSSSSLGAPSVLPDMDPRLTLSALQLASKIRDQEDPLTSCLLVQLCIAQMKRWVAGELSDFFDLI